MEAPCSQTRATNPSATTFSGSAERVAEQEQTKIFSVVVVCGLTSLFPFGILIL